jgi:hypothetical protein
MRAEVRAEIRERLIGYERGYLIGHSDMIMSGLMALGGIVLIDCAVGPGDNALRMVLWLSSATTIWAYHSDIRSMSVWFLGGPINAEGQVLLRVHAFTHFGFFAVLSNAFADRPYWAYWVLIVAASTWLGVLALGAGLRRIRQLRETWGEDLSQRADKHLRFAFHQVAVRAALATGIGAVALLLPAEMAQFAKVAAALLGVTIIATDYLLLKSTERLMVHLSSLMGSADTAAG